MLVPTAILFGKWCTYSLSKFFCLRLLLLFFWSIVSYLSTDGEPFPLVRPSISPVVVVKREREKCTHQVDYNETRKTKQNQQSLASAYYTSYIWKKRRVRTGLAFCLKLISSNRRDRALFCKKKNLKKKGGELDDHHNNKFHKNR